MNEQDRKPDPGAPEDTMVLGPPPVLSPSHFPHSPAEEIPNLPAAQETLGLWGSDKKDSDGNAGNTAKWIPASVTEFTGKLTESLNTMLKNLTELEVSTYVSEDLSDDVIREPEKKSRRIAFTCIKIDGDIESIVPTYDGDVNEHLWRMHLDMVERAQNNRVQLIRTLTEAATGLLQVFK